MIAPVADDPERDFRRLWLAQGVSTLGSVVTAAALPFTAALALGANPAQMALLAASNLVASLLVAPLAGPWLDRRRRRPVMLACDVARAAVVALVPLAALAGRLSLPLLYGVQLLQGALTTLFDLAQRSWLPELVGEDRLLAANARLATTSSVAELSSFSVTGWLVQWLGGPIAIGLDALSFLGSALALTGIRRPERPPEPPAAAARGGFSAWWLDVRAGVEAAFGDPALRALAVSEACLFGAFGTFAACYTIFATRELALPTGPLGMVYALGGVASLGASLVATRLGARFGPRACMVGGLALGAVGLALAPLAPRHAPAVALAMLAAQQLVGDGGWTLFLVHAESTRMRLAAPVARARVAAGSRALSVAAMLAGSALAASVAPWTAARGALAIGAGIILAGMLVCTRLALPAGAALPSSDT